ncbi:sensor histidine kinase [Aggregatilinea lenta]|uniref:sensor histidine kinase n=1 Tax=Aggregatilinea lenta TaxID=913108 RepID=UPI000E5AFE86|nr:ATP-binding protein [Aggregatilinea lenta]
MTLSQAPFISDENYISPSAVPSRTPEGINFAEEVRFERLSIVWKVTLICTLALGWSPVVLTGGDAEWIMTIIGPVITVGVGCALTGFLLRHNAYLLAVWAFSLGIAGAVGLVLGGDNSFGIRYAPFVFPLLIFIVGLLLPARSTLLMFLVIVGTALLSPVFANGAFHVEGTTVFALVLTAMATGLSAQVSGELYAVAEWALESYRKERQTTMALFESREALEKSLLRQRALTQQLQETNHALEQARQTAEDAKNFRGQFLANMSHELRTPLNAIIGFSQTMLDFPDMYDQVELPAQYREDMSQVLNSGKHLLTIINDILDLSKVDAGKLDLDIQPVELAPVVKAVLATAVGLVGDKGQSIKLSRQLPDPLPMVLADPLRIRQVLLNLYSNAAKFTEKGQITLRITREGQEVVFAVEDTGIGIADADRTTIFEEFRQGTAGRKRGRQGAGLGLAISQQLLRLMNGRIWFESRLGKGSTFYIALPVYAPDEAVFVESPQAVPATIDAAR